METICAEFMIVTPMYLGGFAPEKSAGRIPESSVKGALAFWWRALNYAPYVRNAEGNHKAALKNLKEREKQLFGSAEGQSSFLLHVLAPELTLTKESNRLAGGGKGLDYFGFGIPQNSRPNRPCIKQDQYFTLRLGFKPGHREAIKHEIIPALKLFGLLGGLGSRVRRGFGSVALQSIKSDLHDFEPWEAPETLEKHKTALQDLLAPTRPVSGLNFGLSAFASESEIWYSAPGNYVPRRTAFGLPHNYSKKPGVTGAEPGIDWRASPLCFHVHPLGGQYRTIALFLPTLFLPKDKVGIAGEACKYKFEPSIITEFLNSKKHKDDGEGEPRGRKNLFEKLTFSKGEAQP